MKVDVFYDPNNPRRIIVKSPRGYESSFLVIRNEGKIRVIEEKAAMATNAMATKSKRMEYVDIIGLDSHRRWARAKAEELALQGSLTF